jgi:hypothetical protein
VAAAKLLGMLHESDVDVSARELMPAQLGAIMVAIDWIECDVNGAIRNLPEPKRGPSPMDL